MIPIQGRVDELRKARDRISDEQELIGKLRDIAHECIEGGFDANLGYVTGPEGTALTLHVCVQQFVPVVLTGADKDDLTYPEPEQSAPPQPLIPCGDPLSHADHSVILKMSAEDHPARDIAAKLGREARGFHFVVARVLREAAMVTDAEPDAVPTPKATVAAISDGSANLTVLREALPIRLKPSIDRAIQYIHAPSEAKSAASLIEVLGRGVKLSDAALALNYEVAEAQALFKELIPKPSAQAQADMLEVLRAMVPVMERVV